jgi:hypothetical protein
MYGNGFPKSPNVALQIDKKPRGVEQGKRDPSDSSSGRYKTSSADMAIGAAPYWLQAQSPFELSPAPPSWQAAPVLRSHPIAKLLRGDVPSSRRYDA